MSQNFRWMYVLICCLSSVIGIIAQDDIEIPLIAYHTTTELPSVHIFNPNNDSTSTVFVADNERTLITSLAWSDDSTQLAFYSIDYTVDQRVIHLVDVDGNYQVITEQNNMATGMPITWTSNNQLLFARYTGERDGMDAIIEAVTIDPITRTEIVLGTIRIGEGCGGGGDYPPYVAYMTETGLNGNFGTLTLTPYGLVHNRICGGRQTTLTNLATGEQISLGIKNAIVSADRRYVLGASDDSIIRYDLMTGNSRSYTVPDMPAQQSLNSYLQYTFGYNTSDRVIVSVMRPNGSFATQLTETQQRNLNRVLLNPIGEIPLQTATLYQVDFTSDNVVVSELFAADVYVIPRIYATQDDIIFSMIPNAIGYYDALATGIYTDFDDINALGDELVPTQIISLNGGLLIADGDKMVVQPR